MTPTTVISVRGRSQHELLADPRFVYVGRRCGVWTASRWGNPFRVQRQRFQAVDGSCCSTVEEALARYREWLARQLRQFPETYDLRDLRGKRLGCWCINEWKLSDPFYPCHAVILAMWAEETCRDAS